MCILSKQWKKKMRKGTSTEKEAIHWKKKQIPKRKISHKKSRWKFLGIHIKRRTVIGPE